MQEIGQILALAIGIWGEARGEPFEGKVAVAWVVKNRAESNWRGQSTYSRVLIDPKQFSCFNDGNPNLVKMTMPWLWEPDALMECFKAAMAVHYGMIPDPTDGSNHYARYDCRPSWCEDMQFVATIGDHNFYKG